MILAKQRLKIFSNTYETTNQMKPIIVGMGLAVFPFQHHIPTASSTIQDDISY
jgi:hypothetical protein